MKLILTADGCEKVRALQVDWLVDAGYTPLTAPNGLEAIHLAAEFRPRVLLLDEMLPHMNAVEVARYLRAAHRSYEPRIIVMSHLYRNTEAAREAAMRHGLRCFLIKPCPRGLFLGTVESVWTGAPLSHELPRLARTAVA